jgi:hypothetical protein
VQSSRCQGLENAGGFRKVTQHGYHNVHIARWCSGSDIGAAALAFGTSVHAKQAPACCAAWSVSRVIHIKNISDAMSQSQHDRVNCS